MPSFISEGVTFVIGHMCSGAAIPTAPLYEACGVIVISPSAIICFCIAQVCS